MCIRDRLFTLLVDFAAVSIGLLGRFLFTAEGVNPEEVLGNGAQNVLPALVEHTFPPWVVGLYVAAVLSAIMSTVSSLIVMAAGSITHDLYARIFNPGLPDAVASQLCRLITVGIALLALTIAIFVSVLSPERTIFWFVIFGWSGIAATFCPMIILSLFWTGFTERGAIAAMLTGFFMTIVSKFVLQELDGIGAYFGALETMPPSFLAALIVGYLVAMTWPDGQTADRHKALVKRLELSRESHQ